MRRLLGAIAMWIGATAAFAGADEHQHHQVTNTADAPSSSAAPPIRLTINPEARVSVAMVGVVPPAVTCGSALELAVEVVNQGFVTAPLEVALVGNVPAGVTLYLDSEPLKVVPTESRVLRVTLMEPGQVDVTVAFRARNEIPDLGGRDRVHFLVDCIQRAD
jgi:hypothetical protein